MQTFLPYTDFTKVAQTLDSKRLNKQILEGYQILKALSNDNPKTTWRNHPASKMWQGHEFALFDYIFAMVDEANLRGIKTDKNVANLRALRDEVSWKWGVSRPNWFSDFDIISRVVTTHRANLFRKDPVIYAEFESDVDDFMNVPCCDTCSYFWVTHFYRNLLKKVN
jgi:hypothetical protein